jgi:hypothetical protein
MEDRATHARTALEQVCGRGDLDRARELYAEDFVDHVNALDFHGQAGIARSVALYRAVFPDLEIRVVDQTTDGDRVTSRWTLHGTHKDRAVTLPGIGARNCGNTIAAGDGVAAGHVAGDDIVVDLRARRTDQSDADTRQCVEVVVGRACPGVVLDGVACHAELAGRTERGGEHDRAYAVVV